VLHRGGVHPRYRPRRGEWWLWVKESAPLAIGFGLVSLYLKLDIVMLSKLDTLDSVGLYGIGYKFADLATFVPIALLTPVLTVMVMSTNGRREVRRHFRQAFVLLFVAAVGGGVLFALTATPTITLFYGERYAVAAGSARLLVAGACLGFLTHLCVTTLVALGRNRLYALAGLLGLVVNVVLNLVLIPAHSYDGAAVATVVTEGAVLALLVTGLHRSSRVVHVPWAPVARTLVAASALVVVYAGVDRVLPWWVAAAAATAAFAAALHALGVDGPGGLRGLVSNARFSVEQPTAGEQDAAIAEP